MRSVEYYIILTADGMYADPDGGLDHYDPADDEHRYANDLLRTAGVEVMGRKMYDVMTYWDELDVDDPAEPEVGVEFARYWRETPKLVVSRGEPDLGPNATKLEGDVVEAVRALRSGDGPPVAIGAGADLFATLAEAGLIDRYRWLVIPKAIGRGKALFASLRRPLDLRLVGTRTFNSGAVLLEYEPTQAGPG
jgi:dihydrofolate reductase